MSEELKTALKSIKDKKVYNPIFSYIKMLENYIKVLKRINKKEILEKERNLKEKIRILEESDFINFYYREEFRERIKRAISRLKEAQEGLEEWHFDGFDPDLPEIIKILEGKVK